MTKRKAKLRNDSLFDEMEKHRLCADLLKAIDPVFAGEWPRAESPMQILLRKDDAPFIRETTQSVRVLLDCLRGMIRENSDAGAFVFHAAQNLCRDVMGLANDNPPDWLKKLAATEYEIPWLMVKRKPAPGFPEAFTALAWGKRIMKRGKSRLDAPQTKTVARAIKHIELTRISSQSMTRAAARAMKNPAVARAMKSFEVTRTPIRKLQDGTTLTLQSRIENLPPLSRKTMAKWLPVLQAHIRRTVKLTAKERQSIRATLEHDTEKALMNEFWKRCKVAFNGLCPA